MYKVLGMMQEEGFSFFIRGLEPRIREQVGHHVEGNLTQALLMVEKTDVSWHTRNEGGKM